MFQNVLLMIPVAWCSVTLKWRVNVLLVIQGNRCELVCHVVLQSESESAGCRS